MEISKNNSQPARQDRDGGVVAAIATHSLYFLSTLESTTGRAKAASLEKRRHEEKRVDSFTEKEIVCEKV